MPSYNNNTFDDIVYRNSTYYGTAEYLKSKVNNNSWEPVKGEDFINSVNESVIWKSDLVYVAQQSDTVSCYATEIPCVLTAYDAEDEDAYRHITRREIVFNSVYEDWEPFMCKSSSAVNGNIIAERIRAITATHREEGGWVMLITYGLDTPELNFEYKAPVNVSLINNLADSIRGKHASCIQKQYVTHSGLCYSRTTEVSNSEHKNYRKYEGAILTVNIDNKDNSDRIPTRLEGTSYTYSSTNRQPGTKFYLYSTVQN